MPSDNFSYERNEGSGQKSLTTWFIHLLDSKFRIPGTSFRFGIDPIIGLIPGVGDAVTFGMQALLAWQLLSKGSSGELFARVSINILLDTVAGSIPIVGQIFDFFFRANERNLRLVRQYHERGKYRGSGKGIWLVFFAVLLIAIAAVVWATVKLVQWGVQAIRTV